MTVVPPREPVVTSPRMPWEQGKNAFFVSVRGDSAKEITELWEKLSLGATVAQPLALSGWTAPAQRPADQQPAKPV
ncbi:hypothetical protein [Sorangium sp. So ce854]|uniref:hypothetical protein n=1 Tax=Sorangium sp. So ce854 TaxID=3133322 RepID=UPI003F648B82